MITTKLSKKKHLMHKPGIISPKRPYIDPIYESPKNSIFDDIGKVGMTF